MKTREWQRFLETQRRAHAKTVFSVTELANVADVSLHGLNVELSRLVQRGVVVRYARGKYGLPDAVSPEELLPALDAQAYITGAYALHRHHLITQVPLEIACFTRRRHNRSRVRTTPAGRFTFVCVRRGIYAPPANGVLASPEQALCDFAYLSRLRWVDMGTLVTFRRLDNIDVSALGAVLPRYPASVSRAVKAILHTPPR